MLRILDTDLTTILQRRSQPEFDRFQARLRADSLGEVGTTIITFQEQVKGWMAVLNRGEAGDKTVFAYPELQKILKFFCEFKVLPFEEEAQNRFVDLRQQRVRIGTMDLRIASLALTTRALLLSRNLRNFRQVPGLSVEDWTR